MSAYEEIDPGAAHALVDGGAFLLDVRNDDEWEVGHAPAATLVPLGQLSERHTELPADRRIVVVCRSGGRSGQATEALVAAGYDAVNLAGGMQAWAALGLPVVTDAGGPGGVA
ncbi:MAG: rhodanese-like domain-containing protein [Actinomycetota bacterium]